MNKRTSINFSNYVDDPNGLKKVIKIAIIGPSRVGKTSIIAALLDEARTALAQTNISITAFTDEQGSSPTKERINSTIREIEAGLESGEFNPTGIGTAYPFIYDLQMSVTKVAKAKPKKSIRFAILDYPGGWLTNPPIGTDDFKLWENCQKWIADSSVLIVPVDSNLLIQSRFEHEKVKSREILGVLEVRDLIEIWGKERWSNQQSALLLFVPVKCETYFNDNGGNINTSEFLYQTINSYYASSIDLAKKIMSNEDNKPMNSKRPNYSIEYHPIDTIGCIELTSASWKLKNEELFLDCHYMVRNPDGQIPIRKPFGTKGLLTAICKQLLEIRGKEGEILEKILDGLKKNNKLLTDAILMLSQIEYTSRAKIISQGELAQKKKN
jgi:GTPase SAR1 family protein